jgi:uncharacterized protein (DUF58 family)
VLTLTEGWVITFGVLAFVGLVTGEGLLVGLGMLVLLTWAVAWAWNRVCLARVDYQREITPTRAFIGETVEVRLRLTNRKGLPMSWVRLEERFPSGLPELGKPPVLRVEEGSYPVLRATSLARYERVTWRFTMECKERGFYRFGPGRLTSGDVFGFFVSERRELKQGHVIVYPDTVPLPALGLPARRPFGDIRGGPPFYEDPTRLRGLRDYAPDDPIRRVDWKATARARELRVRVFDPSVTHNLVVVLNVETLGPESGRWGYSPVLLERAVTAAASIVQWGLGQRYSVGFMTNSISPLTDEAIRIPASRAPQQLAAALEGLAVVGPLSRDPMASFLPREARRIPGGATLVLVTAALTEELADAIHAIRREGYQPAVVWVAETPMPRLPPEAVTVYEIGRHMARLEAENAFRRSRRPAAAAVAAGGR